MAAFADLLQRIVRSVEEAGAQRPGDDLRARLGYGSDDDYDYDNDDYAASDHERETDRGPEADRAVPPPRRPNTARELETARILESVRSPGAPRSTSPASLHASETHRTPSSGGAAGDRRPRQYHPPKVPAPSARARSHRIRARLRAPDSLRDAFVVKEILDRPLVRRK